MAKEKKATKKKGRIRKFFSRQDDEVEDAEVEVADAEVSSAPGTGQQAQGPKIIFAQEIQLNEIAAIRMAVQDIQNMLKELMEE